MGERKRPEHGTIVCIAARKYVWQLQLGPRHAPECDIRDVASKTLFPANRDLSPLSQFHARTSSHPAPTAVAGFDLLILATAHSIPNETIFTSRNAGPHVASTQKIHFHRKLLLKNKILSIKNICLINKSTKNN